MTYDEIVKAATTNMAKAFVLATEAAREAGRESVLSVLREQVTCPPADRCDSCVVIVDLLSLFKGENE